jgi:hypothetical protein
VAFTLVNGTNIGPGEGHMQSVVVTFVDADHHGETWTSTGGDNPGVVAFTRK